MELEDLPGIGRLFDMHAIDADGEKFDRAAMNRAWYRARFDGNVLRHGFPNTATPF